MSEMQPPEGDQRLSAPPPEPAETVGPGVPAGAAEPVPGVSGPSPRPKLHWGFVVLGFAATVLLSVGISLAAGVIFSFAGAGVGLNLVTPIAGLLELAVLVGMVIAVIAGRRRGSSRVFSLGIGGLSAYVAVMLLSLLLVGTCFVSLGTGSGLFGN